MPLRAFPGGPPAEAPAVQSPPRDQVSLGEDRIEKSTRTLTQWALVGALSTPCLTTSSALTDAEKDEIRATVQPGDVLLRNRNGYPLWNLYEHAQFGSSDYNHSALYIGNGRIIEAGPGRGTAEKSLDGFLHCNQAAVLRPRWRSDEQRDAALSYALAKVGTPYDPYFNHANDNELYCSELVYHALRQGAEPIDVPVHHVLGDEKVGPDAFLHSPDIDVVWSKEARFNDHMTSHWMGFGLIGSAAAAGCAVGGGLGAAVGAVGGVVASALLQLHNERAARH